MSRRALEHTAKKCLMESLGERDSGGWMCCYCGTLLLPYGDNEQPQSATLDHMTPLARGGTHEAHNLALCCLTCNNWKGQLTACEFRAAMAASELAAG